MYKSFIEVVKAVREKYANVERLSKTEFDLCVYGHSENGIGCAIGCLFPADVAKEFDKAGRDPEGDTFVPGVSALLHAVDCQPKIHEVISQKVSSAQLAQLQYWHDYSDTVEEFLKEMDVYLAKHDKTA